MSAAEAVNAQRQERFMGLPDCTGFQFGECMIEFSQVSVEVRMRARRSCELPGVPLTGQVFSGADTSSVAQAHL